ncbi:MAG: hypothetical protein R3B09_17685 [Nannocystaceae bacterium]
MVIVDLARGPVDLDALGDADAIELRAEAVEVDALAAAFAELRGLRGLKTLRLASRVRALPPGITELRGLQHLSIVDAVLPGLPAGIDAWTRLRTLRLRLFHLASLPRSVAGLVRLRELAIDSHHLCGLPRGLSALVELRALTLILRHDYVHDWQRPAHFNPRFTQPLAELFTILAELPALAELTLSEPVSHTSPGAIFAQLPVELGGLRALETLRFVDSCASVLPAELSMPWVRRIGRVGSEMRDEELRRIFPNAIRDDRRSHDPEEP